MSRAIFPPNSVALEPHLAVALEAAVARISELSGRISASSVAIPWRRRAAFAGYARGLQLQGVEIDDVDVFSWACGISLPGRPRRTTVIDEFGALAPWLRQLQTLERSAWKDALPFPPSTRSELPRILQALELQRQYALRSGSIDAWLSLPTIIYGLGLSRSPLPCLVAGSKAFRLIPQVPTETVRATLKAIETSSKQGLAALDTMETAYRASIRAIRAEFRPGKLTALLALSLSVTVLSPASVATALDLSVAGAGKLLDRAAALELLVEISGRRSWKTFVAPDLAIRLGIRRATLGRPRKEPPPLSHDRELAGTLEDFDREMAEIDARLAHIGSSR